MMCRSIDLKNTKPLIELCGRQWRALEIREARDETKSDQDLETFNGDAIDKCSDEPYLFSPGPNRHYLAIDECNDGNCIVYSGYKALMEHCLKHITFQTPPDISIILIADLRFVGAILQKGKVVVLKEMVSAKSDNTSKSEKEIFRERIQAVLNRWDELMKTSKFVFIRCTKEDKEHFFEENEDTEYSKYRHIPFETGKPTIREFERVYDRLMRCVNHGPLNETLKDLRNDKTYTTVTAVENGPSSSSEASEN